MTHTWDRTIDLLVAGSGAAGLTAAITAADAGLTTLVVESTDRWGGTTMRSGGGLWMPNNPVMRAAGMGHPRCGPVDAASFEPVWRSHRIQCERYQSVAPGESER